MSSSRLADFADNLREKLMRLVSWCGRPGGGMLDVVGGTNIKPVSGCGRPDEGVLDMMGGANQDQLVGATR